MEEVKPFREEFIDLLNKSISVMALADFNIKVHFQKLVSRENLAFTTN